MSPAPTMSVFCTYATLRRDARRASARAAGDEDQASAQKATRRGRLGSTHEIAVEPM